MVAHNPESGITRIKLPSGQKKVRTCKGTEQCVMLASSTATVPAKGLMHARAVIGGRSSQSSGQGMLDRLGWAG